MFDLRLPIGSFFLINAAVLIIMGFVQPTDTMFGADKINLNLVCGGVFLLFGAFMTGLSLMDKQKKS